MWLGSCLSLRFHLVKQSLIHNTWVKLAVGGFPGGLSGKESPAMQEMQLRSLGQEDPLEEKMTTHSSILVWEIPWTEEPWGLQSMGSQRVRRDWATKWTGFWLLKLAQYILVFMQALYVVYFLFLQLLDKWYLLRNAFSSCLSSAFLLSAFLPSFLYVIEESLRSI